MIMYHSHLNDMEIPGTKRFIPKGFEMGATLSYPIRAIEQTFPRKIAYGTCWSRVQTFIASKSFEGNRDAITKRLYNPS